MLAPIALLALAACTGRQSPDSTGDTHDSTGDSTDSVVDSDTGESGDSHSDSHDTHETGLDCELGDPTGQVGLQLQSGGLAALYYSDGDAPLMPDGYAVVVAIMGSTGGGGVPIGQPYASSGFGYVQVYVDVPMDRRGLESRSALAATARFAAGVEPDAEGCYLADRVSVALSTTPVFLLGRSNGGNLAIATLADTTQDMPDTSGIVMYETPINAQLTDIELGAIDQENPRYQPGNCAWDPVAGMECGFPTDPALAWDPTYPDLGGNPVGALYDDVNGNGVADTGEYPYYGVETIDHSTVAFSPQLTALIDAQGVTGPDRLTLEEADAWWAERDGSRLAVAALESHPGIPLISIGTEVDHGTSASDHPNVKGAAEVWRGAGSPWVRVNPAPPYMNRAAGVGPAWTDNPPNLDVFLGNPDVLMEPDEFDSGYGTEHYCAAALLELAERTITGDWSD